MRTHRRNHLSPAFTLVELLVVISIVVLLIAVLLPAIGQARYKAKVVKCKAVLRGVTTASVAYAYDSKLYFPTKFEPWTGTDSWFQSKNLHQQGPWQMSDHGQDKGPLYREYLGGDLDDTMECPLSSPRYSETQFGADCSYTIYTINNASMKWVDMYAQPGYERLYTAWQPDNNPNLSFTVIVSDSALTHTSGLPYATHPGPKGSLGEVGNSGNREQFGWLLSPTDTAPINYADADGSVRSYDFDVNSRFSSAWVQVPGNMPHFVPREMAK